MPSRIDTRLRPFLALTLLAPGWIGCGPPGGQSTRDTPATTRVVPLLRDLDSATVLRHEDRLALPSSPIGSRFVRGWWPVRHGNHPRLVPMADGASIEIVRLRPEPARLHLVFDEGRTEDLEGIRAEARIGDRVLDTNRDDSSLIVELPADLGVGRHLIALRFAERPEPIFVRGGVLRPRRPAGTARLDDRTICLEGDLQVEQVRDDLAPGSRLVGGFLAPEDAFGRRFSVAVESRGGGLRTVFEWPGDGDRFDVDLGPDSGLVRVRLSAHGDPVKDDAGCFTDLALHASSPTTTPKPASPKPVSPKPVPPKLVLVYVLDALRADFLGHVAEAHGIVHPWTEALSPNLDRLAREGATFLEHFAVAPNTLPSTKALFTGRTFVDRGGWKLAPDGGPTLAEILASHGYRTALFSANYYVSPAFGTDRGFEHVDEGVFFDALDPTLVNDSSARVHAAALAWLETVDPEDPVFLYLHSLNPHNPYRPPKPWIERFTDVGAVGGAGTSDSEVDGVTATLLDIQHQRRAVDAADQARLRALYAASVAYADAEIGKLLGRLRDRYRPEDVLLVFTSDHGEELFEHDGVLHGYTLYREMLHIPLVIHGPGRIAARQLTQPTDTLDLFTSLLELTGAGVPPSGGGRSLVPLLTGSAFDRDLDRNPRFASASSVEGGIFAAHTADRKVIWAPRTGHGWGQGNGRGRSRDGSYVFDLDSDPAERQNLAGHHDLEIDWLDQRLRAWVEAGLSRDDATEPAIDEEARRQLEALGYLDG